MLPPHGAWVIKAISAIIPASQTTAHLLFCLLQEHLLVLSHKGISLSNFFFIVGLRAHQRLTSP